MRENVAEIGQRRKLVVCHAQGACQLWLQVKTNFVFKAVRQSYNEDSSKILGEGSVEPVTTVNDTRPESSALRQAILSRAVSTFEINFQ